MSTWINEGAPQNHNPNGNSFIQMNEVTSAQGMMDPSAFMANSAQFNPGQFANPQQQQQPQMAGIPNGQMRNASPSFQNPVYQTNPVIPSKRPRPREDSLAGSPRQNPGMLPTSRSETPQQFPGYQPGGGMPQQPPGQGQNSPYPHLQPNGSTNATPSPIMANNMRPGSVPQRVATASPHPFSPSTQQFAPQPSPVPSEHGTPQPNHFMQQNVQNMQAMPQGFNPGNFAPSASPVRPTPTPNPMGGMMPQQMQGQMPQQQMGHMGQMPGHMFPPNMQQRNQPMDPQQMAAYQARLKQYQGQNMQGMHPNMQMAAQMQAQGMGQGRGMMPKQPMPMQNGQVPPGGMRPQQRPGAQENFMKSLAKFLQSKGATLETNIMVGGRTINIFFLFQHVQQRGGYKQTTASNQWPHVLNALGIHPTQLPQGPGLLKETYERVLLRFEEFMAQQQQNQRMMQQGMQNHNMQGAQPQQTPTKQMSPQGQMSPQAQAHPGQSPAHMIPAQAQTPVKQPQYPVQPGMNGMQTPQGAMPPNQSPSTHAHARNSLSRSMEGTPGPGGYPMPSPARGKPGSMQGPQGVVVEPGRPLGQATGPRLLRMARENDGVYEPMARLPAVDAFGGIQLEDLDRKVMQLETIRVDVPTVWDLGMVDLQALTRSIESGIHGEVRMALDTLATITYNSSHAMYIQLNLCEDLVDALLECAEDQLEQLAEDTVEVSDDIQLTPYEDVARACWVDEMTIRPVPEFASPEYELDRAVDRLICILTILRNLSYPPQQSKDLPISEDRNDNISVLADESVIKFLCVVIRYMGTRNMLLRSHTNTLELMKDAVVLLANIACAVEISSREQAECLLQFLLAFAPAPGPTMVDGRLFFPHYEGQVHSYLAPAINALANFLARDEPNRTYYKAIFSADPSSPQPYELLTRTFGMAVSVLPLDYAGPSFTHPQQQRAAPELLRAIDANRPLVMQALLSADILASLAPGPESDVARLWLNSGNGLAQGIHHIVQVLSGHFDQMAAGRAYKDQDFPYIVSLGFTTLKKLAEKSHDPNDNASPPLATLPSSGNILKLMQLKSESWAREGIFKHLGAYSSLERW
jgi:SWI/SNF chromatin-remodeling complex subunit SWI1